MHFIIVLGVLIVLTIIVAVLYVRFIASHMSTVAAATGKDQLLAGTSGLTWLRTKLMNWKTIILGWLAAATQAVSLFLSSDLSPFKDLPWTQIFEEKIAGYITFGLAVLATITHVTGLSSAAQTPPQN